MKYICQLEYPHIPYITRTSMEGEQWEKGQKTTIKTSGCGLCASIMAADRLLPNCTYNLEDAIALSYATGANGFPGTYWKIYVPAFAEKMGLTYASLEEIFSTCRVVSLHTARNPETKHMIRAEHFAMLEDGAVFLNTARGEVIDEDALAAELKTGRIRAVLDVYQTEPLPADSPFVGLKNAMLFPHQCGPTYDRRDFVTQGLIDDVVAFFEGKAVKNEIFAEVARRMTH